MNGGDIIKVTKSVMLREKSYPPGDYILRVFSTIYYDMGHRLISLYLVLAFFATPGQWQCIDDYYESGNN